MTARSSAQRSLGIEYDLQCGNFEDRVHFVLEPSESQQEFIVSGTILRTYSMHGRFERTRASLSLSSLIHQAFNSTDTQGITTASPWDYIQDALSWAFCTMIRVSAPSGALCDEQNEISSILLQLCQPIHACSTTRPSPTQHAAPPEEKLWVAEFHPISPPFLQKMLRPVCGLPQRRLL